MAKLSRSARNNHNSAVKLLNNPLLNESEVEFIFNSYHEAATHLNAESGAFFTPFNLAWDAVLELGIYGDGKGFKILDLCAGIGVLSYCIKRRYPAAEIVSVDINSDYVEVGKKLVPEAGWHCINVGDLAELRKLGHFNFVISNPPFGRVRTFRGIDSPTYKGGEAEYKAIDIAAEISNCGVFILPQ